MTDTEFVLLIDSIRDSSPEQLRAAVRAVQGDPLRQRFFEEALAFYGLMSVSHELWSGPVERDESDEREESSESSESTRAVRELIALRMLTPIDDAAPRWLHHCLQQLPDDEQPFSKDESRRWHEITENLRRLERESPVEDGLLRHTGLSMEEIRAVLPGTPPSEERPPATRRPTDTGGVREPLPIKRRLPGRALVACGVLLLVGILGLSTVTRSPAVSWTMSEARLGSEQTALAIRGGSGEASAATVDAEGGVLLGWATLRESRRTWLGLFPRFQEEGVRRAAVIFERAGTYAEAPASIRGEALYGVAVTSWLSGDRAYALAALSDPAVSYSGAADRAELLEQRLRRNP